jgi:hypothetical protein
MRWFSKVLAATALFLLSIPVFADDSASTEAPPRPVMVFLKRNVGCKSGSFTTTFHSTQPWDTATADTWLVEGCGAQEPFFLTYGKRSFGNYLLLTDRSIRKKAAFDLDCPAEQIEYSIIDIWNRGATGCDSRIRYVWVESETEWVANVASSRE